MSVENSDGQELQELAIENGIRFGEDMYLLAEQHPCLALLEPRLVNAF